MLSIVFSNNTFAAVSVMANVFETVPCGEIPGRNEVRLVRSYEHKARESVKILTKAHFKAAAALCG